jgi:ABC-type lipoprotein release transport system permease subunit
VSRWRFVIRSLIHHWRVHLAVLLGVSAATAVLTGALLVGDSMRGSLQYIALDRLGRIDHIILSDRFFRAELAAELMDVPQFTDKDVQQAIPAILLQGTVELTRKASPPDKTSDPDSESKSADRVADDDSEDRHAPDSAAGNGHPAEDDQDSASSSRRSATITLLGIDERFWKLGDRLQGGKPVGPDPLPENRQIVLNAHLAEQIGADIGDELLVRLPRIATVPADSPMGRKTDTVDKISELIVVDIIPTEGLGRFSLSPSQQLPLVAYVDLPQLQQSLKQANRVNAMILAGRSVSGRASDLQTEDLAALLRPSLEDFGLRIKHVRREFTDPTDGRTETILDYFSLSSDRMLLPPEVDAAAEQAFAEYTPQSVYTYLANTIAKAGAVEESDEVVTSDQPQSRPIPYSTITALNSTPELGPLYADDGTTAMDAVADDEIVLHSWAAEQLQVAPGDRIAVTFFEPESTHGQVLPRTERFELKAVVPLTEPEQPFNDDEPAVYTSRPTRVNDPDLTPEVPGVTDKESLDDWDPPFPFQQARIKPPDDEYWENHRTTPKAFIALEKGRELWESRFGRTTTIRIPATDQLTADAAAEQKTPEEFLAGKLLAQLYRDRATPGFALLPLRQNAIEASAGATPFDWLFLGFSMFIIASALMLVAVLFRLGIEQRAGEIGTLLAVGLRRRSIARLFGLEGSIVAATGGLLGMLGGLGYAWLMLAGLKTWWISAIVTPFVDLYVTEKSLAIGYAAGAVTAAGTFAWGIANLRRVSLRQLLAGRASMSVTHVRRRYRISFLLAWLLLISFVSAWLLLVAASALLAYGTQLGGELQALAFFGAGASLLASGLVFVWRWFRLAIATGGDRGFSSMFPLVQLALRNAARNPGRSTLTIGLVAAASFLIVAISAFQLRPSAAGTGGFDWIAETSQPVYQDLSSQQGRGDLGIIGEDEQILATSDILGLRVQPGDDASCLNLFRAKRPRVIGLTPAFVSHFDDPRHPQFAFAAPTAGQRNLWKLLDESVGDDAVPVILDRNTAMYALHLYGGVGEIFEMRDDVTGRPIRFQVVALTADSIFQGNLLVSEANFERLFPGQNGYRLFLVRAPQQQSQPARRVLEDRLSDYGFRAEDARKRMEALQTVQNTYLSTFQSLGALGLLLGTFGLATVQLRSVLERRAELALMRAAGFRRSRLAGLVLCENAVLLIGGLLLGIGSALITVLPHMVAGGAALPVGMLLIMLAVVPVVGLLSGLLAVRATLRAPLIPALRGD